MHLILGVIAILIAGCGHQGSDQGPALLSDAFGPSEVQVIPLLDPFSLTPVNESVDPFYHHRPAEVVCPSAMWGPEGGGFEIQTGVCNYASFDQPLSTPLQPGDVLHILVWHDTLDFPEPALAHVGVWVGKTVLWETQVPIPAESSLFEVSVRIEEDMQIEERLGLHLHNHGFNSWRFVAVDLHRHPETTLR